MPCVGYRVEAVVRNSSSTIYELFRSLQPILTGDIHPSILLAETLHPSTYREQLAKVYNEEFIDHQLGRAGKKLSLVQQKGIARVYNQLGIYSGRWISLLSTRAMIARCVTIDNLPFTKSIKTAVLLAPLLPMLPSQQ